MKWTGLNDLREMYLSFFESKGHLRLPSFPLIPQNDKSLFLINSGMAPMKKYFLGQETPPRNRVTTCQKCIRTPDIENVGKTARHGTFFEMLGNFSFGDYFKHEATAWAWEFFTKVLEMPEDKLWITIYQDDDEAFDIWTKEIGVPAERIVRMGKEDNFWEHGTGPCGPCSEIHFDRGPEKGCGKPDCKVGCECDRYVEVWNLVFSQFDSDGNGHYAELAQKNIDTGMGLERLACVMQGVDNLFEVDTIQNIMKAISDIAGVTYGKDDKTDVSLRVITDHIRSTVFMIADGVIPKNEGRGYVLRRLLRRAARHGRLLGIKEPFLYKVVDVVAEENKTYYPEIKEKVEYIKKMVLNEEQTFNKTIGKGSEILGKMLDTLEGTKTKIQEKVLSGRDAFTLYDTYGFPLDLIKEIIAERNIVVDEDGFKENMEEQRQRARDNRATDDAFGFGLSEFDLGDTKTEFLGYDTLEAKGKILGISYDGEQIETAIAPQKIIVVTDQTPFYAESGGQVADKGMISNGKFEAAVVDVKKSQNGKLFMHYCIMKNGQLNKGDTVDLKVNKDIRMAITRNHTTAHILQAALRKILGNHVHQAGQLVNAMALRFDFSHFEALTPEQLKEIEMEVNKVILSSTDVKRYETDIHEAKAKGAMALFGEKYGNRVRVCEVGDYSMELCGGTHVKNTSEIGLFKIVSETSVASGVRRIEAVTGLGVVQMLDDVLSSANEAANQLKIGNYHDLVNRSMQVMEEIRDKNNEIDKLNRKLAETRIADLIGSVKPAGKVNYITAMISGVTPDNLKIMGDRVKELAPNAVGIIVGVVDKKANMLCVCGEQAIKNGMHAGKIVKEVSAVTGGKGGGKPDQAMAGVGDLHKIDEALETVEEVLLNMQK